MTNQKLVVAFHKAALFLIERIKYDGWVWSSNDLREHVRCTTGMQFSNTLSPKILREVIKAHPEIARWIEIGARKGDQPRLELK